jgi:hypothetical protein
MLPYQRLRACHKTKPIASRRKAYSPECVEEKFFELRHYAVLGSSDLGWSQKRSAMQSVRTLLRQRPDKNIWLGCHIRFVLGVFMPRA